MIEVMKKMEMLESQKVNFQPSFYKIFNLNPRKFVNRRRRRRRRRRRS